MRKSSLRVVALLAASEITTNRVTKVGKVHIDQEVTSKADEAATIKVLGRTIEDEISPSAAMAVRRASKRCSPARVHSVQRCSTNGQCVVTSSTWGSIH